uniref:Uncharacterized protein n=1 Tax=Oryza punctata TaxID=4537 RepID=A0A0E0JN87_ORYPU
MPNSYMFNAAGEANCLFFHTKSWKEMLSRLFCSSPSFSPGHACKVFGRMAQGWGHHLLDGMPDETDQIKKTLLQVPALYQSYKADRSKARIKKLIVEEATKRSSFYALHQLFSEEFVAVNPCKLAGSPEGFLNGGSNLPLLVRQQNICPGLLSGLFYTRHRAGVEAAGSSPCKFAGGLLKGTSIFRVKRGAGIRHGNMLSRAFPDNPPALTVPSPISLVRVSGMDGQYTYD